MKDPAKPNNRHKYDAAFRAEALRLAEQSRSTQAASWALNIDPKRLYQWQKAAQTLVAAALGAALYQPKPTQANRVWVSDITYLPLVKGAWAYLCAFQDVATKHVVGWYVAATMPEELVTMALQWAFLAQQPIPEFVVHSERGSQYCGNAYRALLHQHGAVRSQSRRGRTR